MDTRRSSSNAAALLRILIVLSVCHVLIVSSGFAQIASEDGISTFTADAASARDDSGTSFSTKALPSHSLSEPEKARVEERLPDGPAHRQPVVAPFDSFRLSSSANIDDAEDPVLETRGSISVDA